MAVSLLRICALILGSALLIPLSCTGGLVLGTFTLIELDERDISKGDRPHSRCYVIASRQEENGSPVPISLSEIKPSLYGISELCGKEFTGIETSMYSFLLPVSEGEIREGEWTRYNYVVKTLSPEKQLIEVNYSDDDVTATFRYLAEPDRIEPLSSKLRAPGHMFGALPYAWAFTLILYIVGRFLRRKYAPEKLTVELKYTVTLLIVGGLVPLFLGIQFPLMITTALAKNSLGGYAGNTGMHIFWVSAYILLAIGCWVTAFLRLRRSFSAARATRVISIMLIIFFPLGTAAFAYWFWKVRKTEGEKGGFPQIPSRLED